MIVRAAELDGTVLDGLRGLAAGVGEEEEEAEPGLGGEEGEEDAVM